jgi:hypothetical protein
MWLWVEKTPTDMTSMGVNAERRDWEKAPHSVWDQS